MGLGILQKNSLRRRLTTNVRNSLPVRYPDLGLMCVGIFVMLLGVGAVTVIRNIYARDHGSTLAELGLMSSAFLLGSFIFQLPGGWMSDKWGRKPLLLFGMFTTGIISILFLVNDYPWYFIVLRFIEGAAAGAVGPAANAYVMDTVPSRERGAAFGWLGSAFSAGFMLGPAIGGVMVDVFGYASPFIFGGIVPIVTAFYLLRKMHNRKPGEHPEEEEAEATPVVPEPKSKRQIPHSLFVPALIGALVLTTAGGFADGLFMSLWSIWLADLHASTSFIGLTFITFSLPVMVLMPITGKMSDKRKWLAPQIAIPGLAISLVYLTYGFTENLALIAALGLLEGSLVAIMGPALSAYVANLSPDDARGRLQGFTSTSRTMAGFASSMLVTIMYASGPMLPFLSLALVQVTVSAVGGLIVWSVERRTYRLANRAETVIPHQQVAAPVLESAAK